MAGSEQKKLSLALVSSLSAQDVRQIESLDVSKKQISELDDLSVCVALRKLNLASNSLTSIKPLEFNRDLTLLNVSNNALQSLDGIQGMFKLTVLNASHNKLTRVSTLPSPCQLLALVLNNNEIVTLENISRAITLTTLVLSHNRLADLNGISSLRNLVKLSVAHNQLRLLPSLAFCPNLKELRLNDNKLLSLPTDLHFNGRLEVLDIGHNLFQSLESIAILSELLMLINLNVKGNPFCSQQPNYKEEIKTKLHTLRILDNERFDPAFLDRRKKRMAYLARISKKSSAVEVEQKPQKRTRENLKEEPNKRQRHDLHAQHEEGLSKHPQKKFKEPNKLPKVLAPLEQLKAKRKAKDEPIAPQKITKVSTDSFFIDSGTQHRNSTKPKADKKPPTATTKLNGKAPKQPVTQPKQAVTQPKQGVTQPKQPLIQSKQPLDSIKKVEPPKKPVPPPPRPVSAAMERSGVVQVIESKSQKVKKGGSSSVVWDALPQAIDSLGTGMGGGWD